MFFFMFGYQYCWAILFTVFVMFYKATQSIWVTQRYIQRAVALLITIECYQLPLFHYSGFLQTLSSLTLSSPFLIHPYSFYCATFSKNYSVYLVIHHGSFSLSLLWAFCSLDLMVSANTQMYNQSWLLLGLLV